MGTEQTPPREDESPAQRQARQRRERRNAKIQAGGSDRLNKITSLNGRAAIVDQDIVQARPTPSSRTAPTDDDPPEVDISSSFTSSKSSAAHHAAQQEALLRQMLRQPQPGKDEASQHTQDDPMIAIMQQIMGDGQASLPGGVVPNAPPPELGSMFGGNAGATTHNPGYVWRIVHAVFATAVAAYAASVLTFATSPFSREHIAVTEIAPRIFWTFAAGQLLLQSARFLLDRGRLPQGSMLSTIASFLPPHYAHLVRLASRYSVIYSAIVSDAMLVVFVLGAMAWLRGHTTV